MSTLRHFGLRIAAGVVAVSLAFFGALYPVRAASEGPLRVQYYFKNSTPHCAWLTAYWSYKIYSTWHIESGTTRWVAPGKVADGTIVYNSPDHGPQMRLQAEVRPTAKCEGSGGYKVQAQRDIQERPAIYGAEMNGDRGCAVFPMLDIECMHSGRQYHIRIRWFKDYP